MAAFKARRRPRLFGAERTRFPWSSLPCYRAFNSALVSSVVHEPLGTSLSRIGGDLSAAVDSSVSDRTEVMPSTLPALVKDIAEASLVAALWKFIRRCGSAINLGRSIARCFFTSLCGRFVAMRPKRRIFPIMRLSSDSAFFLVGVRTRT